jgi:hypothetical protein
MMRRPFALFLAAALAGCASAPSPYSGDLGSVALVPSPYEPAAQFSGSNANYTDGAVIGAAGGAGIGAISAQASAGLLCTIGGPLCLIVVIPAAIVGGLVGGVTGVAVDALTTDPGGRIASARGAIEQAVADMRLTESLAAKTSDRFSIPLKADSTAKTTLEVGVSELEILAREKDMALVLRGRSRLYRTSSGELLDERSAETRTEFRKYQDWAADEAEPLRRAVDSALAELSRSLVKELRATGLPAYTAARRGG